MTIKFTVEAEELNRAIRVASIVQPELPGSVSCLFFMVRGEKCDVYSRDKNRHEARSSFSITAVEGEGAFMFPYAYTKALSEVKGAISFTATENEGAFKVKYTFGSAGKSERVSMDPRVMSLFEKDIQTAIDTVEPRTFSIDILQFGLGALKYAIPKATDEVDHDFFRTIRMFGNNEDPALAKGNGYLLCSNGKEVCYVQCSAFLDKDLSIPQAHLGLLESFLSKSTGEVKFYPLKAKTYVINSAGDVLGWPKADADFKKFDYYKKTDEIVVAVPKDEMLNRLKFMRDNLPKDKFRIRLHYSPDADTILFTIDGETAITASEPLSVSKIEVAVDKETTFNVNVHHMLHMFEGHKANDVEFRVKISASSDPAKKDRYLLRTVDAFYLTPDASVLAMIDNPPADVHECRITRYAPSLD